MIMIKWKPFIITDSILNSVKVINNLFIIENFNAVIGKGSDDNIVLIFGQGHHDFSSSLWTVSHGE